MVDPTPSLTDTAGRQVTSSRVANYRAPFLIFMTAYLVSLLFAWLITVIVIHSEPQANRSDNDYYVQINLAEMTLQLFMYCCLLCLASLSMAWFADLQRTKAARSAAAMVGTFCKSVWLYTMWYSISTFYSGYNDLNWFCGGGATGADGNSAEFPGATSPGSDWCATARTVAVVNVLIGAGLIAVWVWTIVNRFARITPEVPISTTVNVLPAHNKAGCNANSAAHNLDISWRTVLTSPDDLEQSFIAAAYPHIYGPMRSRTNFLSKLGTTFLVFISIGSLLLTYPSLAFSKNQGLNSWSTTSYTNNVSNTYVGWGDPIIAGNWYWLMLTLGVSLGMTSYADGRSHRTIAAVACCMASLSALQFVSFWIYSARRIHAGAGNFFTTSIIDNQNSEYAEIGGAGLIMISQILIAFTMLARYFTYLPITAEHHAHFHHPAHANSPTEIDVVRDRGDPDTTRANTADYPNEFKMYVPGPQRIKGGLDEVPSYNLPALHGVGNGLRVLIGFEVLLIFAWWVMQVISESHNGVYDTTVGALSYFFNERMFMLTSVLCTASLIAAVYAERHRDTGTVSAASIVCATMLAGFFLVVWPYAYQSVASDGYLRNAACVDGFYCDVTKASGVFALIQGGILFLTLLSSVRTVSRLVSDSVGECAGGRHMSSLLSSSLAWLLQALLWVWAAVTIAATVRDNQVGFFQQYQSIETSNVGAAFTMGYWSSQAFLLLLIITAVSWMLCYTRTTFEWQSRPVRIFTVASCAVLAAVLLPMLIFACRFAQTVSMNSDENTFVAVFILMPLVGIAVLALAVWRFMEPMYRNIHVVAVGRSTESMTLTSGVPVDQSGAPITHSKLVSVVTVPVSIHIEETRTGAQYNVAQNDQSE